MKQMSYVVMFLVLLGSLFYIGNHISESAQANSHLFQPGYYRMNDQKLIINQVTKDGFSYTLSSKLGIDYYVTGKAVVIDHHRAKSVNAVIHDGESFETEGLIFTHLTSRDANHPIDPRIDVTSEHALDTHGIPPKMINGLYAK